MERNRMYHMTEDERSDSASALFAPRKEGYIQRKPIRHSGGLEIIENSKSNTKKERPPSESTTRSWSRASVGSVPPRSDSSLSRRTLTPTKQVSLQAVKRKEESNADPFIDNIDIDLDSVTFDSTHQRIKKPSNDYDFRPLSENSFIDDERIDSGITGDHNMSSKSIESASLIVEDLTGRDSSNLSESDMGPKSKTEGAAKAPSREDTSSEDEDEEEEVIRRAPNELLMEFIDCIIKQDFSNAEKLCKMILLYEPNNQEALKFQPLIEEKMRLDAEAAAAEDEEGSDDDDEDGDDDDDDTSDDDDDTTSSDEDSSEDDDNKEDKDDDKRDLNIPSTSTKDPAGSNIKGTNSIRVWKPGS